MVIHRERFLLLAASLAACHKPTSGGNGERPLAPEAAVAAAPFDAAAPNLGVPPGPPDSSVSLREAGASADASVPSWSALAVLDASTECRQAFERNQATLARASGDCADADEAGPSVKQVRDGLLALGREGPLSLCHPGRGTWLVAVSSAELSAPSAESGKPCGASVTYTLVYVSPQGERSTSKARTLDAFRDTTKESTFAAQFDFDEDGRDELVLDDSSWNNGDSRDYSVEVLRATSGAVESYAVGLGFDATTDADGDGRPDFVTTTFFSAPGTCGGPGRPPDILGVPLLIHSLPGGKFTMSDDIARRWAKRECPTAPTAARAGTDPSCARLWGRSVDEIARTVPEAGPCELNATGVTELVRDPPPFKPLNVDPVAPLPGAKWSRFGG
jgi:hypothetical protein